MNENRADRYRRKAEECRHAAQQATSGVDKNDWLKLAEEWLKLAADADKSRGNHAA